MKECKHEISLENITLIRDDPKIGYHTIINRLYEYGDLTERDHKAYVSLIDLGIIWHMEVQVEEAESYGFKIEITQRYYLYIYFKGFKIPIKN